MDSRPFWWLAVAVLQSIGGPLAAAATGSAPPPLPIRDGVAVGHRQQVRLDGGRTLELETLSLTPLVIRVLDFLSAEECAHIRGLAGTAGMQDGYTTQSSDAGGPRSLSINDVDEDGFLATGELMLMIDSLVDGHVTEADVAGLVGGLAAAPLRFAGPPSDSASE